MALRTGLATVLAALMLQGAALADPIQPAFHRVPFGAAQLVVLRDAQDALPNDGKVFGTTVGPAAVSNVLRGAGMATDKVPLSIDVLALVTGGHVTLFDTGLGPAGHGQMAASLAAAGLSPAQVTDIFITHFHGDHVGGLVDAGGGLAYPSATVHLSKAEWAWAQTQTPLAGIVKAIAPKVRTFDPAVHRPLIPGVTPVPLVGHTPGHTGYQIQSGSAHLIDIGDLAHSSVVSLREPGWAIGFDNDPGKGAAVRTTALAKLAASGETIYAPHFPYPGIGMIKTAKSGYAWQPR